LLVGSLHAPAGVRLGAISLVAGQWPEYMLHLNAKNKNKNAFLIVEDLWRFWQFQVREIS
jgi:hypothetical protein